MKIKLALSTVVLGGLLSGCALMRPPALLVSNSLDYSEYQKKGFFITEATAVNFEYAPVSSVSSLNLSGYKLSDKSGKRRMDDLYGAVIAQNGIRTTTEYLPASRKLVLDELYRHAKEFGANGIIGLKINYIKHYTEKGAFQDGYEATGMAIKRK